MTMFPYSQFPYPQQGIVYVPMPAPAATPSPQPMGKEEIKNIKRAIRFYNTLLEENKKKDGDKKKDDKKRWYQDWRGVVVLSLASPFIGLGYGYALYLIIMKMFT